jgi:hypothetical protein
MNVLLLLACGAHQPPQPPKIPTPDDSGSTVGDTCCPVEEGPWSIVKLTKDGGGNWVAGDMIGRIWAYDPTTDLDGVSGTADWYEYAERETDWGWMSDTLGWRASVAPLASVPSGISCDIAGTHDKCQSLVVVTSTMESPSAVFLTAEPDAAKVVSDPAAYHQVGTYKVVGTFTQGVNTVTQTGWYDTRATTLGGLSRNEAWCGPANWLWPARGTQLHGPVTWDLVRTGGVPTTWPTSLSNCPALPDNSAAATFLANSIKL